MILSSTLIQGLPVVFQDYTCSEIRDELRTEYRDTYEKLINILVNHLSSNSNLEYFKTILNLNCKIQIIHSNKFQLSFYKNDNLSFSCSRNIAFNSSNIPNNNDDIIYNIKMYGNKLKYDESQEIFVNKITPFINYVKNIGSYSQDFNQLISDLTINNFKLFVLFDDNLECEVKLNI